MTRAPEDLFSDISKGHEAGGLMEVLLPLLLARRDRIIREAVNSFRSAGLDATRATAYIAALSEVLALQEEFEYRIRRGEEASRTVFTAEPA